MLDKAYICFHVKAQINRSTNGFCVDEGRRIPLAEGKTFYKIPPGAHTVTITSGRGNQWTIERTVDRKELLTVKMEAWEENISDVLYKIDRAPVVTRLQAKKLPRSR